MWTWAGTREVPLLPRTIAMGWVFWKTIILEDGDASSWSITLTKCWVLWLVKCSANAIAVDFWAATRWPAWDLLQTTLWWTSHLQTLLVSGTFKLKKSLQPYCAKFWRWWHFYWPGLQHFVAIVAILQARDSLEKRIPLLIKIAPDLILAEMEDIAEVTLF